MPSRIRIMNLAIHDVLSVGEECSELLTICLSKLILKGLSEVTQYYSDLQLCRFLSSNYASQLSESIPS